jgi:hypothetical protein
MTRYGDIVSPHMHHPHVLGCHLTVFPTVGIRIERELLQYSLGSKIVVTLRSCSVMI